MVPECCVCHASFQFAMYLSMVCGMLVCVSLSIIVCMFTVSNAWLMSNATAIVGGMGLEEPVATVLLMLCSAVLVECFVLNPCCVVMFGMLCVIYGRITFSSVFVRFENSYDVGQFPYVWYFVVVECGVVYVREVF